MKHIGILWVSLILFSSIAYCNSANNILDTIRLIHYHEAIRVTSNGEAESHITLRLNHTGSHLYLPLMISDEIALIEAPKGYEVGLSKNDLNRRYLEIKSSSSKLLSNNIEFDVVYKNKLDNKFWSIIDEPNLLVDYSEDKNSTWYIAEYSATIALSKGVNFDLRNIRPDRALHDHVTIKYRNQNALNEISIRASNVSFNDINCLLMLKNTSSITPYIIILVILIAVYVVFLRHLFKS